MWEGAHEEGEGSVALKRKERVYPCPARHQFRPRAVSRNRCAIKTHNLINAPEKTDHRNARGTTHRPYLMVGLSLSLLVWALSSGFVPTASVPSESLRRTTTPPPPLPQSDFPSAWGGMDSHTPS